MPRRPKRNDPRPPRSRFISGSPPPSDASSAGDHPRASKADKPSGPDSPLRIIGGKLRGKRLLYSGDPRTRPMKQRVREALFNLVGPSIVGKHAVDLFAGTGAIGLEALSRGAARASFFEQHFPTAKLIEDNVAMLELGLLSTVVPGDSFIRFRSVEATRQALSTELPWAMFCCPPYALYTKRNEEMLALIGHLLAAAPPESLLVVESDQSFDPAQLPEAEWWDVRDYPPARVALLR